MDRALLEGWLDQGLSLNEIGALIDRDPSTVGYWCKKLGLTPNGQARHGRRGPIERERLEGLIEADATLREMAERLDRSISNVRYWLDKHGLRRETGARGRRPLVPRSEVDAAVAAGVRTLIATCPHHGSTTFVIENSGRARCRQCRMDRVTEWRRRAKRRLVEEAGGACRLCGYDRCMAALEFHHRDPRQKSFPLSLRGVTKRFSELQKEAAKCVLLCANCHAEVEVGHARLRSDIAPRD